MSSKSPHLPGVERAVSRLVPQIERAGGSELFHVVGPATAGKSAGLRTLVEDLKGGRRVPILVAPPSGSFDSGAAALVELGAGLKEAALVNGHLAKLVEPQRPWSDKLELLRRDINAVADRVVLLCDEPEAWSPSEDGAFSVNEHSRSLLYLQSPPSGAERQRARRALGRQRPSRMSRPAAHLQLPPARTGASCLCPSLQSASAAPLACLSLTGTGRQKRDASASATASAAHSL
jgi:hypothetical protein